MYSLNQNHFYRMNACHLPYLSLLRGCIILRCVHFFVIFSLNYQQRVTVVWQMRRDYKINFTNKLKANLWIHLDLGNTHHLKGLISPDLVSYLYFLNLNNIMTLFPKLLSSLKLGLIWHDLCLPCFLPARFRCMPISLQNQNKCKLSIDHHTL